MEGFRDRLIITLRFIYDFNFIYLLFLLLNYLIFLAVTLGFKSNYFLLYSWAEIIGLDRRNEETFFYQVLFIPVYNFLDWLLTGNYAVIPKLINKYTKGKISFILKFTALLLMLLYAMTVSVGVYITKQSEKKAEEARIEKLLRDAEVMKKRAESIALKKQQELENKLANETIPYQGLSCKLESYTDKDELNEFVLILRKKRKGSDGNNPSEIDFRTSSKKIDGILYEFRRLNITVGESQISFRIPGSAYDKFNDYLWGGEFISIGRSSLKLRYSRRNYSNDWVYQCEQVSHEELYDYVENHNMSITNKNEI
tara:strand:- start:723 stop:1658 length:936 start_codon:yes stop_codon:yes gene_type:complete